MRSSTFRGLFTSIALLATSPLGADEMIFCDPANPENACPGDNCQCADDTFEVIFDSSENQLFEYDSFVKDSPVKARIVIQTRSPKVQGWSYGVKHDGQFLALQSLGIDGTDSEPAQSVGFVLLNMDEIEECAVNDPACRNPLAATGFVSAIVLNLTLPDALELRHNTICKATYSLNADAGTDGTKLELTNHLKRAHAPPVDINLDIDGKVRRPKFVADGTVRAIGQPRILFHRGDPNADGKSDVSDGSFLANYLFSGGPQPPCLEAADTDDDGTVGVSDALLLLQWYYADAAPPPAPPGPPSEACGSDPTTSTRDLGCSAYGACNLGV